MSENDWIEVDFYCCGVYRGKRRVHRNSFAGRYFSGDFGGAMQKVAEMVDDLNSIDGVRASGGLTPAAPDQPTAGG